MNVVVIVTHSKFKSKSDLSRRFFQDVARYSRLLQPARLCTQYHHYISISTHLVGVEVRFKCSFGTDGDSV